MKDQKEVNNMPGFETKPSWKEIRYRISDPERCGNQYGRKKIANGVSLLVCRLKDGSGWINQALRFDKKIFPTIDSAKKWYSANWAKRNEKLWDFLIEGKYTDGDIVTLGLEVKKLENLYPEKEKELTYWLHRHYVDNTTHQVLIVDELERWDVPMPKAVPPESLDWPVTTDRLKCEMLSKEPEGLTLKDEGHIYLGARKKDFYEYFLGDNRRVIFKLIKVEDAKDTMNEIYNKLELNEDQRDIMMFDLDERFHGQDIWITWLAEDGTPYVLGKRAVEQEWIPPFGHSALPPSEKAKTQERYHYWNVEDDITRIELRDSLVEDRETKLKVIRKYDGYHYLAECEEGLQFLIEYEGEELENLVVSDCKSISSAKKLANMDFTLLHHFWRGKFTLQSEPETEHWDLFLGDSQQIVMPKNPLKGLTKASTRKPYVKKFMSKGKKATEFIKPGSPGNPTRSTPSYVNRIDSGTITILEECEHRKRFEINGGKLRGIYILEREDVKRNKWTFSRVQQLGKDVKLSANQSIKTICLTGRLTGTKTLDDGSIEVSSVTLGEGVWNGDYYSLAAIKEKPERIVGTPILVGPHSLSGSHGKIIKHSFDGRDISTVGHITSKEGVKKLDSGVYKGPSVEVNVIVDDVRHIIERILKYTRVNYVENPACEVCQLT